MSTAAGTLANYPLRYAYGAPPPVEEEVVDLDSSLIWAIRYLECDAVEEMLSEGVNI